MPEGSVPPRWPNLATLQTELETLEGQDELFTAGLAIGFSRRRGHRQRDLKFKIAPVLGGAIAVDGIETMDYLVASAISGRRHRQVKDLPPETSISGFTVDVDVP